MPHLQFIDVDWLDEAWALSELLAKMPSPYANALMGSPSPASPEQLNAVESLQELVAFYLAYRVRVIHKVRLQREDGTRTLVYINDKTPAGAPRHRGFLVSLGVNLHACDLRALEVHEQLGHILQDGYVPDEWKRQLPLRVASIA